MRPVDWKQLDERLNAVLGLRRGAVTITFSQDAPGALPPYEADMPSPSADGRTGKVPAGCVFWIEAQNRSFTTVPADHLNCSVGSVTHGLKRLHEVIDNEDVRTLLECEWVTAGEAMQLPVIQQRPNYISYGPLAASTAPDVVLLRINAFQAMMIHDAFPEATFVGKPQCHIVSIAKEQGLIAISTGCMLSRVRTGMSPDEMTCAIPAGRLNHVIAKLERRREANALVGAYANRDSRRFART